MLGKSFCQPGRNGRRPIEKISSQVRLYLMDSAISATELPKTFSPMATPKRRQKMCYNENKSPRLEGKMAQKDLSANIDFVNKNRNELLREHINKFLLVYQEKLVGAFDSYEKAAEEGVRLFGIDANFLVYYLAEMEPLNFIFEAQS
jgi:hypothetical protein